jgi:hypothetical protein
MREVKRPGLLVLAGVIAFSSLLAAVIRLLPAG